MPEMWDDLDRMFDELTRRYPPGFPYDRNGVRNGIAALEDEIWELKEEWREHKRDLPSGGGNIRVEALQVAAVAMMIVYGIDAASYADPDA